MSKILIGGGTVKSKKSTSRTRLNASTRGELIKRANSGELVVQNGDYDQDDKKDDEESFDEED